MVNYEELVKNYFKGKNIGLTLSEIGKKLNIPYENMDDLSTAIYLLEVNGYLYKIDDTYFRCPKDFIYKIGTIEKSTKGNYYISLSKGEKVLFNTKEINKNKLQEGDIIRFSMTQDSRYSKEIKLNKIDAAASAIMSLDQNFTKNDIKIKCPYMSDSTINRALEKLKEDGKIISNGTGRSATWTKLINQMDLSRRDKQINIFEMIDDEE